MEVLGKSSSVEELKSGISKCCQCSGDSCFMVGGRGDKFALAHFTGEHEYVIDNDWLECNRAQDSAILQSILLSSANSVLVEIAKVFILSCDLE